MIKHDAIIIHEISQLMLDNRNSTIQCQVITFNTCGNRCIQYPLHRANQFLVKGLWSFTVIINFYVIYT